MKRIIEYNITADTLTNLCLASPVSILEYLKSLGYSQGLIAHLKRTKHGIIKNNTWAYVRDTLTIGDCLQITLTEKDLSEQILPIPLPLHIVFEDEDLIIINKPSGMPIHPSQGNFDNTLANAVAYYYQQKQQNFVYRCINRLDRDTTGLLILAKNAYSAALLSQMIAKRLIKREYLAVASGNLQELLSTPTTTPISTSLPLGVACESGIGTITAPIARVEGSTIERMVDFQCGEFAKTNLQVLAYKNGHSLVSLVLETGRTHQIRVHLKYIGYPIPGDFLYHPDYSRITRQALHSYKLTFTHPITNQPLSFTAPLPEDMQQFF